MSAADYNEMVQAAARVLEAACADPLGAQLALDAAGVPALLERNAELEEEVEKNRYPATLQIKVKEQARTIEQLRMLLTEHGLRLLKAENSVAGQTHTLGQLRAALADCARLNCSRTLWNEPNCGACTTCRARTALEASV